MNHARSIIAVHMVDVASSDQHTVKPWFTGKLDYSPPLVDLAQAGYPLIGGRIDILDQRPVAAIVYQHGDHFINLFVLSVSDRKIDLNVRSERGYHFCGWNKAGLNYLCISETSSIALEAFEDQVGEHTILYINTPASVSRFSGFYEIGIESASEHNWQSFDGVKICQWRSGGVPRRVNTKD